ncbi:hypothetical protein BC332_22134 [Capsicum chinense]|uniref:ZF-HD dimerization-type domain-containing protein n=1 Tax=Capsicum annuum TaxID=4072 RepID=A0A1U8DVA8_CAPAN|nr:zinc-finger homeodomain protein 4 [Capsicum annuum]KAF3616960.1 putative ATP-dependent Clp protease ATP-binding subunit ClpX-like [Capsicum annuum]KAF3642490.1 putative ATP-dependent Clp protease ATP-binding subunit ClpX-like [Capsicum annuum]PHT63687.1 hypothetical protein T459_32509 [Capsicum annuum]PHU10274.1 hypothetical protein BC332_22134 [Capsicum chinense]
MELPSQEEDMPIPINSTYVGGGHGHGHGHMIHHDPTPPPNNTNHIIPPSMNGPPIDAAPVAAAPDHHVPFKKMVRYKECLKNHAAAMGGTATDGCGEFMPSGEEGTIEALICSACNCHRNFHRKEMEGEQQQHLQLPSSCDCYHLNRGGGKKVYLGHNNHHHKALLGPEPFGTIIPTRPPPHHQMIMSYNMGSLPNSESEEHDQDHAGIMAMARPLHHHHHHHVKKRFRTKFTQEQKDKMLNFAEKVGWKIQKQEEAVVQQFCQEVGVKRRVLKVWMHNNKHSLAKKNSNNIIPHENQV